MNLNRFALFVKGPADVAVNAASGRGFVVNRVEAQLSDCTRLDASHELGEAAAVWLGEDSRPLAGEGFVPGALLYFQYR